MAKKKDSKVSITSVDRMLKAVNTEAVPVHVEVGDESIDFEVKPLLDIATFNNMVHEVVNASFVIDEDTGEERYDAVYEQYAEGVAQLTYVANFKPEMASDKLYRLMNCREVMDEIKGIWGDSQRCDFRDAVYDQIAFKKQALLATERRKLQQAIDQIDKANDLFAKFVAMFEGVDPTQLMEQMQKIAGMSEAEIASGLVDARDKDFVEQRRAALQVLK